MAYLWIDKSFRIFSLVLCLLLCSAYPAFSQSDSTLVTNPAYDSLIKDIADSLFRAMEKAVPPVQNVQVKTGVATQQDVVNFSDIAKRDSLNRTKTIQGKPIHRPLNPVDLWYKRTLDSLRQALDTARLKLNPSTDSVRQNTTAPKSQKRKASPHDPKTEKSPKLEDQNIKIQQPEAVLSPLPDMNFSALEDDNSGIFPPDVGGAVGPAHLMVTLNTQVRAQDRQGKTILAKPKKKILLSFPQFKNLQLGGNGAD